MTEVDVVIIGAGISGLAAGLRLKTQAAHLSFAILEASDRVGGLIRTECVDGFVIERGPESVLTEKPAMLTLASELGIAEQVIPTRSVGRGAYVMKDGALESIPEGYSLLAPMLWAPFLRSSILSTSGKARALMDLVLPRGRVRSDESLGSFVRRRFGPEMLDRLAQPLASGIYGADPDRLSLGATMPRFLEAEQRGRSVSRGLRLAAQDKAKSGVDAKVSGVRYGLFVSFQRGLQTVTDALGDSLREHVMLNATVSRLETSGEGYRVTLADGREVKARQVIVAIPSRVSAPLLSEVSPHLSRLLDSISFGSSAAVMMAFDAKNVSRPLDAFGVVVPRREGRPMLASTWISTKFEHRAPEGVVLLRVFLRDPNLSDDALSRQAYAELAAMVGVTGTPTLTRVDRYVDAMPQYEVGHRDLVAAVDAALARTPGIYMAGNSLYGVGLPDAISAGSRAALAAMKGIVQTQ